MAWHRRVTEQGAHSTSQYGDGTEFTIRMHYGGQIERDPEVIYHGGQVAWFDFVETDRLSMHELRHMLKDLGFKSKLENFTFFHKLPNMGLEHGLRKIMSDTDILDIQNHIPVDKEVDVYVDMPGICDSSVAGSKADEYIDDFDESSDCSSFCDSQYDSCEDDMLFDENVNRDAEYAGISDVVLDKVKGKEKATGKSKRLELPVVEVNVHNKDIEYDSDDGLKEYKSDDETYYAKRGMAKGREFNPKVDMENPKFELYMTFRDHKLFQKAVKRHSIVEKRQISFVQQRSYTVRAVCKAPCPWLIYASKDQHEKELMVKTYNPTHKCNIHYKNKHLNSRWLASEYIEEFRGNPNKTARDFTAKVFGGHSMNISRNQAYRAKNKALKMIDGSIQEQYNKLWDYAEELIRRNPGSTVKLITVEGSIEAGKPMFERFYVCLKGLKCFLKGEYGGQLLVASAIDPNNNWYPIAYAVVESETKSSWLWFVELLISDLEIENDFGYTIMSDKQKGLIDAINTMLPNAEHRFCVMHMHGNMRNAGFKRVTYREYLWCAAKTTTVRRFEHWMGEIAKYDPVAFRWFDDKPSMNWSRSHFRTYPKCDILLNNLSESFNAYILNARDKPILTCLETIRQMIMVRLETNRQIENDKWGGMLLCPKIHKEVEKRKNMVKDCIPSACGGSKYEVICVNGDRYSVNIDESSCTCKKWDLSGIPCSHAISCMYLREEEAEEYVHECYKVTTYQNVYSYIINPMDGPNQWPRTGNLPLLPPIVKKKAGRPRKLRKRKGDEKIDIAENNDDVVETQRSKRWAIQRSLKCSICKMVGHNKRTCDNKSPTEANGEASGAVETHGVGNQEPWMSEFINTRIDGLESIPPSNYSNSADKLPVYTRSNIIPVPNHPHSAHQAPSQPPVTHQAMSSNLGTRIELGKKMKRQCTSQPKPSSNSPSVAPIVTNPRRSPRKKHGSFAPSLSHPAGSFIWNSAVRPLQSRPVINATTQPPPGLMQIVVPTGREKVMSDPRYSDVGGFKKKNTSVPTPFKK